MKIRRVLVWTVLLALIGICTWNVYSTMEVNRKIDHSITSDIIDIRVKLKETCRIDLEREEEIRKANVYIVNLTEKIMGSGTHIKIGDTHYILTCSHLQKEEETLWVIEGKLNRFNLTLVKKSKKYDLALFRINNFESRPYLELAGDLPKVGSRVFLVGNPSGINDVVTEGIVAKISIDKYLISNKTYFGNSGGCLFYKGKIVGVMSCGYFFKSVNYGMAVKHKIIMRFLDGV